MPTPPEFQAQILPYLYDLLDRQERLRFEAHLEENPEARAELEEARSHQFLLSEAARDEFLEVNFAAPVAGATHKHAPQATQPALETGPARRGRARARWAMAASVLALALGGTGYFALSGWNGHKTQLAQAGDALDKADRAAFDLQRKIDDEQRRTQKEIREVQDQINKLIDEWQGETNKSRRELEDKGVRFIISGPKNIQAGAKNEYQIEMTRPQKAALVRPPAPMVARVVNPETKEVIVSQKLEQGAGAIRIDVPPHVAVAPGANFVLEIQSVNAEGAPVEVREHLKLVSPEYVTHLATDRPMYRPGEVVRFRSLTLERFSLRPPQEDLRLRFTITDPNNAELYRVEGLSQVVADAKKAPIVGPDGTPLRGIGVGEFQLPQIVGGQFTLTIAEMNDRFPAEKRTFLVNDWQQPRLNKEVTFNRSSYGPGDSMQIHGKAARIDGAIANLHVELNVLVDGVQVAKLEDNLQNEGLFSFDFKLPLAIKKGDGIVALKFSEGAHSETLVRPIPILLNKLLVDFYPEGGDLIAGVVNRVYFQARTPTGKPADLRGTIVDAANAVVAQVQTVTDDKEPGLNQGMGAFEFMPRAGETYRLKVDEPLGITGEFTVPSAKADGVVLHLDRGVVDNFIDVSVTSAKRNRELLIGAYCRGRLLDVTQVSVAAGQTQYAALRPALGVGGVYRITVFEKLPDNRHLPLAERLIFRRSPEKLDLAITPSKAVFRPGERAQLSLGAANERKEMSGAVLMVSVVDLSVSKLANDKTARTMPTHFLLTSEVRRPEELENADFFLGKHPKAELGLDLLLGVQGWRRFAEVDPSRIAAADRPDAAHVVPALAPAGMQKTDPDQEAITKVDSRFVPKFVELEKSLAAAEKVQAGIPAKLDRLRQETARGDAARTQIAQATQQLSDYERWLFQTACGVLVVMLLVVGIALVYWGMRRMSAGKSATTFFSVGGALLAVLMLISLGGTFYLMSRRGQDPFVRNQEQMAADMNLNFGGGVGMIPPPAAGGPNAGGPNAGNPNAGDPMVGAKLPHAVRIQAPMVPPPPVPKFGNANAAAEIVAGPGFAPAIPPRVDMAFGGDDRDRRLRLEGKFSDIVRRLLNRPVAMPESISPFVVREYAHQYAAAADRSRIDFTETVCWQPVLVLADGKGQVSFDLADSTTQYQVLVAGHTLDGRIGAASIEFAATLPYAVDPRVPTEVTASDRVVIPVVATNNTDKNVSVDLIVQGEGSLVLAGAKLPLLLAPGKAGRRLYDFQPPNTASTTTIIAQGRFSPAGFDSVTRTFRVVPDGFPVALSESGLLEGVASHSFTLPETWVNGTLDCQVQVFPSTLAELQKGLEALLREPCGCFEQSSTSNYPNVLILNYLKESNQSNPDLEKRTRALLDSGYQKLTSFECMEPREQAKRQGYEWFGQTAPPHEALTAYGLLQFTDMAKVFPVKEDMLARTRQYLLDARDGKGGFKRNPRSVDSFGRAPEHITNAYIVWALSEADKAEKLDVELKALYERAKTSKDPYFVALVGISHLNLGLKDEALELLRNLREIQKAGGELGGATTSITASGGRDLDIEATALGVLGWLRANRPADFHPNIDRAVKWLGKQRGSQGSFGSTQSTILALKALIAFTEANKKAIQPGELRLIVNGAVVATQSFSGALSEPITLRMPANVAMRPGANKVSVETTDNAFPYTMVLSFRTEKPANVANCPVQLRTSLGATDVSEGDTVRLKAMVTNKSGKGQGMAVAIIGLPAGLSLPEDMAQLKELAAPREEDGKMTPGVISAWEIKGRELVLYWRDLAPDAKIDVNLDLVARLPGTYRGPASRSYLYYNADHRFWVDPLSVTIHAQE